MKYVVHLRSATYCTLSDGASAMSTTETSNIQHPQLKPIDSSNREIESISGSGSKYAALVGPSPPRCSTCKLPRIIDITFHPGDNCLDG